MEAETNSLSSSQEEQLMFESNLPPNCYRLLQGCSGGNNGYADGNDDGDVIDDVDFLAAEKLAKESGSLTPLVKQELKLLIQIRRLSQGKDELKVRFDRPMSHKLTEADLERRRRRKDQNRRAAKRFRQNKKFRESTLLEEISQLEGKNQGLRDIVDELKKQKEQLLGRLAGHLVLCPSTSLPASVSAPSPITPTLSLSLPDSSGACSRSAAAAAEITPSPQLPPDSVSIPASQSTVSGLSTSASKMTTTDYSTATTFSSLPPTSGKSETTVSHFDYLGCDEAASALQYSSFSSDSSSATDLSSPCPGSAPDAGSALCPSALAATVASGLYFHLDDNYSDLAASPRPRSTTSSYYSPSDFTATTPSLSPCPVSAVQAKLGPPCLSASDSVAMISSSGFYHPGGYCTNSSSDEATPTTLPRRPCSASSSQCLSDFSTDTMTTTTTTPTPSLSPCPSSSGSGGFSITPLPESSDSAVFLEEKCPDAAVLCGSSAAPSPNPSHSERRRGGGGGPRRTPLLLRSSTSPYPTACTSSSSQGRQPSAGNLHLQQVPPPLPQRPSTFSYYHHHHHGTPASPSSSSSPSRPLPRGLCGSNCFVPIFLQQALASRNASYLDVSASPSPSPPAELCDDDGAVPAFLQQQQQQQQNERDIVEARFDFSASTSHAFAPPPSSVPPEPCRSENREGLTPAFPGHQGAPPVSSSPLYVPPSSSYPPPPSIPASYCRDYGLISTARQQADTSSSSTSLHVDTSVDQPSTSFLSSSSRDENADGAVLPGFIQQHNTPATTPASHGFGVAASTTNATCSILPPSCEDETDGDSFVSILLRSMPQSSRPPTSPHLDSLTSTTPPTTSSCGGNNDLNSILPTFLQPGVFFDQ